MIKYILLAATLAAATAQADCIDFAEYVGDRYIDRQVRNVAFIDAIATADTAMKKQAVVTIYQAPRWNTEKHLKRNMEETVSRWALYCWSKENEGVFE